MFSKLNRLTNLPSSLIQSTHSKSPKSSTMRTTWRRVVKTKPLIFLLTVILSFTCLTDNSFGYSESDLQKLLSTKECVGCDLSGADLSGLDLREADLTKANLSKADLTKAKLITTNLTKAKLTQAKLTQAKLRKANLSKADLTEANLTEANLSGANLKGTNLKNTKGRF